MASPEVNRNNHENKFQYTVERACTEEAVREFYAFADIILEVNWGVGGPPEKYTPEWIVKNPDKVALFVVRGGANNEIIAGSMIRLMDEEGMGEREMPKNFSSKKMALLEYTAVHEKHRQLGIQKKLHEARQRWASENSIQGFIVEIVLPDRILQIDEFKAIYISFNFHVKHGSVGVSHVVASKESPVLGITNPFLVIVRPVEKNPEVGLTSDDYQKMGIVRPFNKRGGGGLDFSTFHVKDPEKVGELLKQGYFLTGLTIKNDIVHYVLERLVEQNT